MAIFRIANTYSVKRPPITDASYISPNYLEADSLLFGTPPFYVRDRPEVPTRRTGLARSVTTHFYESGMAPSWGIFFYGRYRYYFRDVEFETSLSLGALSNETNVTVDIFSAFKEKNRVESISVPVDSGIAVTNLSVGDRVQPYSLFPLELNIAKEGAIVVNGPITVTFGNGRSWVIGISFVRVTVPISLLDANWAEGVSISRSFLTDVFTGADMSQTRKALRKTPVRRHSVSLLFRDRESALRAWAASRTSVSNSFYFPLATDVSVMTAESDGLRVFCDVSYRRFEAGQFVLLRHGIVTGDASGDIYGNQIATVAAVETDGLTLSGVTLEAYERGDRVYPMIRCLPNAGSTSLSAFTRSKGLMKLDIVEEWGPNALALENSTYSPTVRYGLPIFDYRINEATETSIQVMHGGETVESGRGFSISQYGEAYQSQSLLVLADSRELYWDLIGFFNYVKGRAKAFWIKQYMDTFQLIEQDGAYLRFESDLNASDLAYLAYLWIEDDAGNKDVVKVLGVTNTVEGFDILCSASTLVTNATEVFQALAVVQSSDQITESWLAASVVEISFTVEEAQGTY